MQMSDPSNAIKIAAIVLKRFAAKHGGLRVEKVKGGLFNRKKEKIIRRWHVRIRSTATFAKPDEGSFSVTPKENATLEFPQTPDRWINVSVVNSDSFEVAAQKRITMRGAEELVAFETFKEEIVPVSEEELESVLNQFLRDGILYVRKGYLGLHIQ